jgi:hypothetical protein
MHKADRRINVSWTAEWITYGPGREPENDGRWLGSPRTAGAPEVAAPISAKSKAEEEELLAPLV